MREDRTFLKLLQAQWLQRPKLTPVSSPGALGPWCTHSELGQGPPVCSGRPESASALGFLTDPNEVKSPNTADSFIFAFLKYIIF